MSCALASSPSSTISMAALRTPEISSLRLMLAIMRVSGRSSQLGLFVEPCAQGLHLDDRIFLEASPADTWSGHPSYWWPGVGRFNGIQGFRLQTRLQFGLAAQLRLDLLIRRNRPSPPQGGRPVRRPRWCVCAAQRRAGGGGESLPPPPATRSRMRPRGRGHSLGSTAATLEPCRRAPQALRGPEPAVGGRLRRASVASKGSVSTINWSPRSALKLITPATSSRMVFIFSAEGGTRTCCKCGGFSFPSHFLVQQQRDGNPLQLPLRQLHPAHHAAGLIIDLLGSPGGAAIAPAGTRPEDAADWRLCPAHRRDKAAGATSSLFCELTMTERAGSKFSSLCSPLEKSHSAETVPGNGRHPAAARAWIGSCLTGSFRPSRDIRGLLRILPRRCRRSCAGDSADCRACPPPRRPPAPVLPPRWPAGCKPPRRFAEKAARPDASPRSRWLWPLGEPPDRPTLSGSVRCTRARSTSAMETMERSSSPSSARR